MAGLTCRDSGDEVQPHPNGEILYGYSTIDHEDRIANMRLFMKLAAICGQSNRKQQKTRMIKKF